MNRHRDAEADVSRVNQRRDPKPAPFRKERDHRHRHGKRDGRVRRRPAPKHTAPQNTETEIVADVRTHIVHGGMHATGEHLVSRGDERADERRLPNGPAGPGNFGVAVDVAGNNQDQRQRQRHQPADGRGRNHPRPQLRTARGTEIKPVKPGRDADERERDEQQMPENYPPLETAEDVFR